MRKQLLLLPAIAAVLTACAGAPQARPQPSTPAPSVTPATPAIPATPTPPTPAPVAPTRDLTVQSPPSPAAPTPPAAVVPAPAQPAPSAALSAFLDALQSGNSPQAWALLSQESQRELGGSLDAFITRDLAGLRDRFAGLKGYRMAVNRQVSAKLAVVAVTSDRATEGIDVVAFPFVQETGGWKVALSRYPITPIAKPGAGMIGYRTTWANPTTDGLWVDNVPLTVTRSGTSATAKLPPGLAGGPHVAVAISVSAAGVPTAYGWMFSAPTTP